MTLNLRHLVYSGIELFDFLLCQLVAAIFCVSLVYILFGLIEVPNAIAYAAMLTDPDEFCSGTCL